MTFVLADRIKETTATTGTGTLSLAGAVVSFQSFLSGIGNGNSTCYGLVSGNGTDWEIGIGTIASGTPNTLTRTTILASSNSGSAISLSGTSTVWGDDPARKVASFYRGSTSGTVTVQAAAVAGTNQITLPAATGTLPTLENAQTWSAPHTWNGLGNTAVKIGAYGAISSYNFISVNGDLSAAGGAGIIGGDSSNLGSLYLHAPTQVIFQVGGSDVATVNSSDFYMNGLGHFKYTLYVDGPSGVQSTLFLSNGGLAKCALYRANSSDDLRLWVSGFGDALIIGNSSGIPQFPANYLYLGGRQFLLNSSFYNVLYDGDGNGAIFLGGTGDTTNYYRNTYHSFGSVGGAGLYATLDVNGLHITRNTSNALDITNGGGTSIFTFSGNNSIISTAPSARSDGTNLVFNAKTGGGVYINNDISGGQLILNGLTSSNDKFVTSAAGSRFGTAAGDRTTPTRANTNILLYDNSSTNWAGIGADTAGYVYIVTGTSAPASRVIIDTSGFVGIGGSPAHQLHLSTDDAYKPNGGSWGNSSDARIKKNINYSFGGLDKVRQLKPALFEWINPQDHGGIALSGGFIAQDMMQVFPQYVTNSEPTPADKALIPAGERSFDLTLHNSFFGYLTKSIQELDALVTQQQNTIEALTARLVALEKKVK
jgi:hypothetical protein